MQRLYRNDRALQWAILAFMLFFYGGILLADSPQHAPLNFTFNSMAEHLLRGRFDVDPHTVGYEGFLRDGRVYAYWGIYCALLRIPFVLLHATTVDSTLWSQLAAVCLSGMMLVRTVLLLRRHLPRTSTTDLLCGLMLLSIIFGGPQFDFLETSIFQEVTSWAAAFGMVFVYFSINGLVVRNFDAWTLTAMSLAAGLAVNTRIVMGLGLCVGFGLLVLVLLLEGVRSGRGAQDIYRRLWAPCLVLAVLLVFAGVVNQGRWGSPFVFADHRFYLFNAFYPGRLERIKLYGYFNLRRVPLGFLYFFFPVWAFHNSAGELYFQAAQLRLFDAVELPPSSFLLTDLLPFVFIATVFTTAIKRIRSVSVRLLQALALAMGLAVPCFLLISSYSLSHRYRLDFYPEIEFLALLGLYAAARSASTPSRELTRRRRRWLIGALVVSLVSSCVVLALYKLSDLGPSLPRLHQGLYLYYRGQIL